MKYYKLTVLKDFPGYKQGEVFDKISEDLYNGLFHKYIADGRDLLDLVDVAKHYPDFVKTEFDFYSSVLVSCPNCNSVNMFPYIHSGQEQSDGEIYVSISSGLECAICGGKREIRKAWHHVYLT